MNVKRLRKVYIISKKGKAMKKYIGILLSIAILLMSIPVYADDNVDENYPMIFEEEGSEIDNLFDDQEQQIIPRSQYISTVVTTAKYLGSNKVAIHVDAYCGSVVKSITTNFYLQKYTGSGWVNVSSGTASVSNSNKLSKTGTVSGVPSGTYRAKSSTKVTDSYGYSETLVSYSGAFSF